MAYYPRELTSLLARALKAMPVVVVTGMRQVGKTTFLWNQAEMGQRLRYSLDDLAVLAAARQDPEAMVSGQHPVIIDEVHRVPDLLLAIKSEVFRNRLPGQFVLSGSANLLLMDGVTESLAGRATYLTMWPMTRRELQRKTAKPYLIDLLESGEPGAEKDAEHLGSREVLLGGMPPVVVDGADPEIWFAGFEQTYLERDIRELSQVADLTQFRRFVRLLAMRTGKILNVAEVARDAGVSSATAHRYVGLMETSFAGFRLPPFLANRSTRLVKSPKYFVSDSGLANHLIGPRHEPLGSSDQFAGPLVETYVAQNLQGILTAWAPRAALLYWHVQGRHEVDFVIEQDDRTVALEVKYGSRWSSRDLSGLEHFVATTPNCVAGILACNCRSTVPIGNRLFAVPLTALLS